jgi:predicted membrane-bound mannosyltransferase
MQMSYIMNCIAVFLPPVIYVIFTVTRPPKLAFIMPLNSFLIYWSIMNLAVYSYVQEKVPWLVLNIVLPLVLLASIYINEKIWTKTIYDLDTKKKNTLFYVLIISFAFMTYTSLLLNFYHYDNPAEPLIQAAQPPQKFAEVLSQFSNTSSTIQVTDDGMETQFLWYLRHHTAVQWKVDAVSTSSNLTASFIVVHDSDSHEADTIQTRLPNYQRLNSSKMSWYWLSSSDVTPKYILYRYVNRPPDEYRIALFTKIGETT